MVYIIIIFRFYIHIFSLVLFTTDIWEARVLVP